MSRAAPKPLPPQAEAEAQNLLGHQFARPALLAEALTHRSAAGASGLGSNERLEFIGDRVLGLVIAEWLIERFPKEQEGKLGLRLAALVSRDTLAGVAEGLGLGGLINVAPGQTNRSLATQANVLADALEAMIGALFLDAGFARARHFVREVMAGVLDAQALPPKDPKTALQELAARRNLPPPVYTVAEQSGPSHAPSFVIRAVVGAMSAEARAGSKRAAEQEAARTLLGVLAP